ncbi:MAG: tryptophan synthase subunit alpha [Crocinitomicaceae bacterium]|nr:tryptophan synthase subunit alpha [Crocinitomicaceae bacterium]
MNPFKKNKKQLSIFITAGYPKINSLAEHINMLETQGVDFIEVGIPFSDPMADGPVIQNTSAIALDNGMNMKELFNQLANIHTSIPIVLMGYLNPVLKFGLVPFLQKCKENAVASVILPDMSVEIYERFYEKDFQRFDMTPSFLITPTTDHARVKKIAAICQKSFVYLVSANATTGSEDGLQENRFATYQRMKEVCQETPLFVGFGIRTRDDVQNIQRVVDGAIIGSAYLESVRKGEQSNYIASLF